MVYDYLNGSKEKEKLQKLTYDILLMDFLYSNILTESYWFYIGNIYIFNHFFILFS